MKPAYCSVNHAPAATPDRLILIVALSILIVAPYVLLADVGAGDPAVLCAALLHDTLEDTQTTLVERRERFGEEVAGPAE